MREELFKQMREWLVNHPNPYTHDSYEDAYWTVSDLADIVEMTTDDYIVNRCSKIFNRVKFHYY